MRERLKNWIANGLLVAASIFIVLIGMELFLYYDDWHPDPAQFMSEVTLNGTIYEFLDTADAINRQDSAVLISGDSFTAGRACADNRNYPSVFTEAAGRAGTDLHAVNMGIVGTGPISYVLRVRDYLAEKGSAAGVILTFYANDIEIDCESCRNLRLWSELGGLNAEDQEQLTDLCRSCLQSQTQGAAAGSHSVPRRINAWLAGHSFTYNLLREAGAKLVLGTGLLEVSWGRRSYPEHWRNLDGVHFKQIRSAIELAKRETDRRSIPLMVVFYPDPLGLTANNEYVEIYKRAQENLSASANVRAYSGYEAFLGNDHTRDDMRFSLTDTHPSCEAHEIFGQWVFEKWTEIHEDAD